ncbi:LPS export ABC transporter periplasmic protein LptC [Ectothiorhodospiraceae bacterium BW-2]|nr:LPS export ABC transporter periplasmic protein LptC [Ectothiorhodospiraceae bacterium BW-2]
MPRLLSLLLLALGLLWGGRYIQSQRALPPATPSATAPIDYRIEQPTLSQSSANGTPRERLQATRLIHYPERQLSELLQPRLNLYSNEAQWQLQANGGLLYDSGQLLLQQQVELYGPFSEWPQGYRLQTETLSIDMALRQLSAPEPVTLHHPQLTIRAGGLELALQTQQLHLFNGVTALYQP